MIPFCSFRTVVAFGFVGAITLSGCDKVGPDFVKPDASLAPNWLETGEAHVRRGQSDFRSWWRVFKDPTLDRLVHAAYRQNLPLKIAGVRVLEARAQLGVAVGDLFPQKQSAYAHLEGIKLPKRGLSERLAGNGDSLQSFVMDRMGVMANWELDIWGKFRRAIEGADANLLAAIANYDDVLVTLTADVATAYINLRTLERRIEIAHDNVRVQRDGLRIADAKFRGGSASRRDVEQAKTVLASTEATIPVLEAQVRQTKNALCLLLGMPPARLADWLGPDDQRAQIPTPPVDVAVGIPADLLRRRPDVRGAELAAAAQSTQIGVARANLFPAFSLSGNFGFVSSNANGSSLGEMFSWGGNFYRFGPAVSWNLFNYGQITNQVRIEDALFQERLLDYQNKVLKAQKDVEDALIAFLRQQDAAEFLAQATAAAKSAVQLATLQYIQGIADFTTVLTAQQSLLQQQNDFAITLGDIATSLVGVYRNLGGGWQIREGQEFVPPEIKQAMANRTNWGDLLAPASISTSPPKSLIRSPDW